VVSILVGLATILGLIVFIIPGIYIAVRLAVSIQALVVEGRRGTEASGNDRDPAVRRSSACCSTWICAPRKERLDLDTLKADLQSSSAA